MKLWLVARCGEESQSAPAKGGVTCLNPARRIGHFNYFWPQLPRPDGSGRGFRILLLTSRNGPEGQRHPPDTLRLSFQESSFTQASTLCRAIAMELAERPHEAAVLNHKTI